MNFLVALETLHKPVIVLNAWFLIQVVWLAFFARLVWKLKTVPAIVLGAAYIASAVRPIENFLVESFLSTGVKITVAISDWVIPVIAASVTLTLIASFLIALRRRKIGFILAMGVPLVLLVIADLGMHVVLFDESLFYDQEFHNLVVLRDQMQTSHLVGGTTTALLEKFGLPNQVEGEQIKSWNFHPSLQKVKAMELLPGGRQKWIYQPGRWYVFCFDDVVVEVNDGQVERVFVDVF